MPRGFCRRHGPNRVCSCAMGNLYRFVEPVVLFLLRQRGRSYGYELGKALQEHALTDAEVDRAALYRTLMTLEENGYVSSEWDTTGPGPARHLYKITPAGEAHLEEWLTVLENMVQSMQRFLAQARAVSDAQDRADLSQK
ncbi:MAG: PadR family transcriptional regulator [Chthonomonadales bacterium]